MKSSTIIFLLLTFLTSNGFTQLTCDISKHYEDFIQVSKSTHNGRSYLLKNVVETKNKSCFSNLINTNPKFMDYLLTNFSSMNNHQDIVKLEDSIAFRKAYFDDLRKDSLYTDVMSELVNKSIFKKTPKDSISMDKLLNIAVKYFSVMKINDEGHYVGKVCVGLNDIKKTEKERQPFVEAFCFSSILDNYQGKDFNMYDEFIKSLKELYKVNLGLNKDEKLLRSQGAMYFLMKNSEPLKNMLIFEYERQKGNLPFVLTL